MGTSKTAISANESRNGVVGDMTDLLRDIVEPVVESIGADTAAETGGASAETGRTTTAGTSAEAIPAGQDAPDSDAAPAEEEDGAPRTWTGAAAETANPTLDLTPSRSESTQSGGTQSGGTAAPGGGQAALGAAIVQADSDQTAADMSGDDPAAPAEAEAGAAAETGAQEAAPAPSATASSAQMAVTPSESSPLRLDARTGEVINELEITTYFTPTDTLFGNQWHLLNTGQSGGTPGVDMNVTTVWDEFTGNGVTVGVWDDGVQYAHHDLNDNYDTSLHITVNGTIHDPDPESVNSRHGTAVAGVIAAENNGSGTVGVAFDATIAGVDIFYDSVHDFNATSAMTSELDHFDITNHSWGFTTPYAANLLNGGSTFWSNFFSGIFNSTAAGRGGLGTINMVAAGNDRALGRDANDSNFTAMPQTITVGAVSHDGFVSNYSTPGAAILVAGATNSTALPGTGIWTTDRTGADGYSNGANQVGNTDADYTATFGGTSSATPAVAGVVALMLEANPNLGWRDVQDILAMTARHTGSNVGSGPAQSELYTWSFNSANQWNGGGMHFSNDYGFGLVDALAAVRLAESWTQQDTSTNWRAFVADFDPGLGLVIPDANPTGITHTFTVTPGNATDLEHVGVRLDIASGYTSNYRVTLTSPDGTVSELARSDNTGDSATDSWFYMSNAFRGESGVGDWTLQVVDEWTGFTGTLNLAQLEFYGQAPRADDVHVFTNEFSDWAGGMHGHAIGATDTDGGNDTLNFAAVSSDVTLDLVHGSGIVDGVTVAPGGFVGFENAVGGDGNDSLVGDAGVNSLLGMRGNDTIRGQGGDDTLGGGQGDDLIIWNNGDGSDLIDGNAGSDTVRVNLDGAAADDVSITTGGGRISLTRNNLGLFTLDIGTVETLEVNGGGGNDTITGNGQLLGADLILNGGGGNDSLFGSDQVDVINGGNGNDTILAEGSLDQVNGGADNDLILFNLLSVPDQVTGGTGIDTVDGGGFDPGVALDVNLGANTYGVWLGGVFYGPYDIFGVEAVLGTGENDTIRGDGIANFFDGRNGNDSLLGNGGEDTIIGRGGDDTIDAGSGWDLVDAGNGRDLVHGGGGNDTLLGNGNEDTINGDAGNDSIDGSWGWDVIDGGTGNDTISGGTGSDTLDGGADTDLLDYSQDGTGVSVNLLANTASGGEATGDVISNFEGVAGGSAGDVLGGDHAANTLLGNGGEDTIIGRGGDDTIDAGSGWDLVDAGNGRDLVHGGGGNDTLLGNGNEDTINGDAGNDSIDGSWGWDVIDGGTGNDTMTGGTGRDLFIFTNGFGNDVITDFDSHDGEDINLAGVSAITDFTDLVNNHLFNSGGFALIDDLSGNTILLEGVAFGSVGVGQAYSADDFIFV